MHKLDPKNFQTKYASVFVNALYSFGLKHVIISPGSRNTPLTLAFAAHPKIEKHIAIDERSAAFMALGIGMFSGRPAALVCTSGTAPANYFPAIIEAQKSGVPMIVLSADRGFDESNTGANQWIDQSNLYGNKTVFFSDVHVRSDNQNDLSRLQFLAEQAWSSSIRLRGCSHINFPFSKPLEPDNTFLETLPQYYSDFEANVTSISDHELSTWGLSPVVLKQINSSIRPIVVCGPGTTRHPLSDLFKIFAGNDIPILSEAGSTPYDSLGNHIFGFNTYLRNIPVCESLKPDLIIRIGDEPIGIGLLNFLKVHSNVLVIHFYDRENWSNTLFAKETRIVVPFGVQIQQKYEGSTQIDRTSWISDWKSYEAKYLKIQQNLIFSDDLLRDGDVHSILSGSIDSDEILMISNSFAARDIDLFGMPSLKDNKIFMNRGASGIDGITSTAHGLALASNKRVTLVTGDLALVHDLSALVTMRNQNPIHLRIIVINNNGGQIFRMLPVFSAKEYFTEYFETPQKINIAEIAKAIGIQSVRVNTPVEFKSALSIQDQIVLIECKTDPSDSMKMRHNLWS